LRRATDDTTGEVPMSRRKAEIPFFPLPRACPFDPPPELMRRQREEPVSRVRLCDGSVAWLVTRYDDARAALSDPRLSADSRRLGYPHVSAALAENRSYSPTFMTRDNPQHDEQRRMLTRDFMVERVTTTANREMSIYMADLVDHKCREPADDVLSHLAQNQLRTGSLNRDEVAALGQLLITDGHETTAGTIGLSAALLLQHPNQVAELREGARHSSPTRSRRSCAICRRQDPDGAASPRRISSSAAPGSRPVKR
jgi:cytochrome P450